MKSNDLIDIIGDVKDEHIRDAKTHKKSKMPRWAKWSSAIAACLCVAVIGAITLPMLWQNPNSNIDEPQTGHDGYPYNDGEVLDYIGAKLDNYQTDVGTIVFNEITDIEAYRSFNTAYGYENKPYYSTRSAAYDLLTSYPVNSENEIINVAIFEKDGSLENCPNYAEFLEYTEKTPLAADMVMQILEKNPGATVHGFYNSTINASGISFMPESNCMATVVIAEDLSAIDERYASIIPMFQSTLGTGQSSFIGEQEISVHYFYQNRMFRDTKTEEAYQYYVYFERGGLQYLYQFSSNWSLIGQDISAIHNPPSTYHYVETQDECRHLFVDYLLTLIG